MRSRRKEPPARKVAVVEFTSYCRAMLRELSKSATKFDEQELAERLNAAAEEADRVEKAERLKEN